MSKQNRRDREAVSASSPADELFRGMPESVRRPFKQHKAIRRQVQRDRYLRAIEGQPE